MTRGSVILFIGMLMAATLAAPAAHAGTVYRCESPDGSRTYASKRVKGAKCTVVSSYTPSTAAARSAPSSASTARSASEPMTAAVLPAPAIGAISTPVAGVVGAPIAPAVPLQPIAPPPAAPRQGTTRRVEGQVYSYIKDGVRHYTSKPPRGVAGATAVRSIRYSFLETCYACAPLPGVNFGTLRLNIDAYAAEIRAAATRHGVDEAIVRAIIHAESSFNPNARSRVGAEGLMQLMPPTARRFGVGNSYDPAQNIHGGVQYLAWLLKRYNGDLTLAAAGYNAGEGAVDRYKGVPPYSETRRYVERVRVLAERYRGVLGGRG
ncbi:lytic transglycosylase domain-containing protein [Lysobacter hankyongensis]|uniref:Lytic transglycosylase domain-containing protein n=1 Tax=Lysobacter hankyongensis TaxID=1176535 RepID=A0ABP9AMF5_9GAMM